jgi:hypothetical protein
VLVPVIIIVAYLLWSSYPLWSFRHCHPIVVVVPLLFCCCCSPVVMSPLPCCHVPPSPHHCSTHNPPHEQLLMRLGTGGVLSCVLSLLLLPIHCCPPSLLSSCRCHSILVVVPSLVFPSLLLSCCFSAIVIPLLLCPPLPPSLFHPKSTPRAVACEAGHRWCVVHRCCLLSLFVEHIRT